MFEWPLFLAGLCCLAGAAGAFYFSPWGSAFLLAILCLCGMCLFPKERAKLLGIGCCGLLTCLSVMIWQTQAQELRSYAGETVQLEGMVTTVNYGSGWVQMEMLTNILGQREKLDVVSYFTDVPEPGHDFRAVVKLEEANPRYRGKGDVLQGTVLEMDDLGHSGTLYGRALSLRSGLIRRTERLFHGTGGEIILGLLFGERAVLSYEVEEVFEKSGASHLLTVSGFHISMMAGGIYWLLQRLGQKPKITAFLMIPLILFLAMVEGWTVSVVRAAIMSALFYFAAIFERDYDGLSAWGLAVIAILLPQPADLFSLSFLLSFSAVLGILLFRKKLYNFFLSFIPAPKPDGRASRLFCRIMELLAITVAANSLTLPFLWYFFGYIPLIALVSSLVAIPMMPFLLGTAATVILCPWMDLAEFLAFIPQTFADLLYRILSVLAKWDWILYGQDELLLSVLVYFCEGMFILTLWKLEYRWMDRLLPLSLAAFCLIWSAYSAAVWDRAELTSCRSTAVLTYKNRAVIFGSPEKNGDLEEIEKVLNCAHVETVDLLLLTQLPRDSGITARELSLRWDPVLVASVEELDAFDLTDIDYQLGPQQFSFWGNWTLETIDSGALLCNGRKTAAKLHSEKKSCEADALLYDDYHFLLGAGMDGDFTWSKQLKLVMSAA